jgi:hypothetical protein
MGREHSVLTDWRNRMTIKIEVEITEEEVRNAVEHRIKDAIAKQLREWEVERYIGESLKRKWPGVIDSMIVEMVSNSETLKEEIARKIKEKLKRKISAIMSKVE